MIYTRVNQNKEHAFDGDCLFFGSYPQEKVPKGALSSALDRLIGVLPTSADSGAWTSYKYYILDDNERDFMWYCDVTYEGARYRAVYFCDYRPNDTMNTSDDNYQEENGYLVGRVYWFRFEPILWRILEETDGKLHLIADACLDAQAYREVVWENSYVKSSIRCFLNEEFFKTAFSEDERLAVSLELVVNDMEDSDVIDPTTGGPNTLDAVFLLSDSEAARLLPSGERKGRATDYARCQGIYAEKHNGCSVWWLRTPYYSIEAWAEVVGTLDKVDFATCEIGATYVGIRPSLWLKQ